MLFLVLFGFLCNIAGVLAVPLSVCTKSPYADILPLAAFPPAQSFCSAFFPLPRCTSTFTRTLTSTSTIAVQATGTTVTVTTSTVTVTSPTSTTTQTITTGTTTATVTTGTATVTITTAIQSAFVTTSTSTATVTTSTTTSTVFTQTVTQTSTATSTTTFKVTTYQGATIQKRTAIASAPVVTSHARRNAPNMEHMLASFRGRPLDFVRTACSCIETQTPCALTTGTKSTTLSFILTYRSTATVSVATTTTRNVVATTTVSVKDSTTVSVQATLTTSIAYTTTVSVNVITTISVVATSTTSIASTTTSVTTSSVTATTTVDLTAVYSPQHTNSPGQGCQYAYDDFTTHYGSGADNPQTSAGRALQCAHDCDARSSCRYYQVLVYNNYSPPALQCDFSNSPYDASKETCGPNAYVYLDGFGANKN